MQKDVVFGGLLATSVSLLFLYMTVIEIPFYPQDIDVQKYVIGALLASCALLLFGFLYRNKIGTNEGVPTPANPTTEPAKIFR